MPPKKDDKNKKGAQPVAGQQPVYTITEDELNDAQDLPKLNDFIFSSLFAFKMTRNQNRLMKQIKKQFQYTNPEEPGYSERNAIKFRTINLHQLKGQAQARGLITEQEAQEFSKIDEDKRREILAQATVESVTAYQLAQRKQKKDELAAKEAQKEKELASQLATAGDETLRGITPSLDIKVDQILYLQDFPKTALDVHALINLGFDQIDGFYIIEEIFNRDIEDEGDVQTSQDDLTSVDQEAVPAEETTDQMTAGRQTTQKMDKDNKDKMNTSGISFKAKPKEKMFNKLAERAQPFEEIIEINRILKRQPQGSRLRNCDVQRHKFEGPADPMDIPTPPEDGSEPFPIDEERKAAEFKFYNDFSEMIKQQVDDISSDQILYRRIRLEADTCALPLWPITLSEEENEQIKAREELRKSQEEALIKKQEEEKKAAEAAVPDKKGGKKSAGKPTRTGSKADKEREANEAAEQIASQAALNLNTGVSQEKILYNSTDDNPERLKDFYEFQKIMSEMETGTATVGSIMGAMIYQISQDSEKRVKDALGDQYYDERKMLSTKKLSLADKRKSSHKQLTEQLENKQIDGLFQDLMNQLNIEHAVVETDYKHQFNNEVVLSDSEQKSSPYMEVKSENDQIQNGKGAYIFPSGQTQGDTEQKTLEISSIPGVNNRQGMPKSASLPRALRESDQDQIVQFCQLPTSQTKRCLILKAFEDMMQESQPEREFSFLDRNYVEEYKDSNTMRQVLSTAISEMQPDVETQYYEKDDGLLIALFFKNPPGRLMRKQWTHPIRVFPDFSEWHQFHRKQLTPLDNDHLLNISNDKVGVLRVNTKFSFPSDNSVIRVEKYNVGQRRMGESKIIKDNFKFGVRERKEAFDKKVNGEDSLRNRDAKVFQNKNCDFWLMFENGVRLNIEMQEHQEPDMQLIPPNDIQGWLKTKLKAEAKLKKENDEKSESDVRKSQLAAQEENNTIDGALSVVGSVKDNGATEIRVPTAGDTIIQDSKPQEETTVDEPEINLAQIEEVEDPQLKNPLIEIDGVDMTKGSKLTFTFEQGLVLQIQPNGDVLQHFIQNKPLPKQTLKGNNLTQNQIPDNLVEEKRIITTNGEIIKFMADGNLIIYFSDGALTYSDKRKGIWYTINQNGVKRVRKEKDGLVSDEVQRLKIETKIDPETNATLRIREDGVLTVEYIDQTLLIIMPDGTNILRKKRADGEAGTCTFITKDGYVPIRQTYDPVKARAKTIIGLGGTDALMGKDLIMERTNSGKISEVLLPDNTIVQSYLEKQEQEGYNNFSLNMIHIIRRPDFSVVKVTQDGEVVLITANERAYLNDIGKQIEELGTKDYDYFFELFGISSERRSGVYTANLDKGRIWTQDEEGNYFIVYANGDSVEKMSVSFDLDQMVEGIENKEPNSPRMKDGGYIEDECKFLPAPKSMAHPRLFYIRNGGHGCELFNEEQLRHMFRTNKNKNQEGFIKKQNSIKIQNEDCISHVFITKKEKKFDASAFDVSNEFPKLPQSLDLVNQTVSIPTDPVVEPMTYKAVVEFKAMDSQMLKEFYSACDAYKELKNNQADLQKKLAIDDPIVITTAVAPSEKKDRMMRSSEMKSGFGSNSDRGSPRSGSDRGSEAAGSPKQIRIRKGGHQSSQNFELQRNSPKPEGEVPVDQLISGEQDLIDETTGMQVIKHNVVLNHHQRLQLRIANERGVKIDSLGGQEYQVLKEYIKQEKRQEMLNNMHDFFDNSTADEGEAPGFQ